MAHRKNPSALQRKGPRPLSNLVLCTYTRKESTISSWTNRLKILRRTKYITKCLPMRRSAQMQKPRSGSSKISMAKKISLNNKSIYKLTRAAIYSSHFSNTVYPLFSKAVSFKRKKAYNKNLYLVTKEKWQNGYCANLEGWFPLLGLLVRVQLFPVPLKMKYGVVRKSIVSDINL